jgi:tetratricopeptide (TPR) repeat protein
MSLRIVVILLLFIGCKSNREVPFPYEKLSQVEKDSLSEYYKELSYYYLQPSKAHRIAKDTAILLNPNKVENIQVLSYSYKKTGEHIKAMHLLNKAVAMDVVKGSVEALKYRAWSLLYFYRDYEGAIMDVDQIFKVLNTNYTGCWGEPCGLIKGQALMRLKKYDEAIKVLENVLDEEKRIGFNPDQNFLVNFYLGRCFHEDQNFLNAINQYQKVLDIDPKYTEALYQTAMVYLALEEKEKAKEYLHEAHKWFLKGQKMGEPYFERFDELFLYQIEEQLAKL